MNVTYYSFPPFSVQPGKITVIDTGSQRVYRELTAGVQGKADTVKVSDDNFASVPAKRGAQWFGEPMVTLDLNELFQRKLQTKLVKLLADDQTVKLADGLRELLSQMLADSYLMDVPMELPTMPEIAKLVKFSGIQLAPDIQENPYGIIETLVKVLLELHDQHIIVLTNVSHYLQVSQLGMLVRFMANVDLPFLLIEFSATRRKDYFKECDYHYIDSDFVLW